MTTDLAFASMLFVATLIVYAFIAGKHRGASLERDRVVAHYRHRRFSYSNSLPLYTFVAEITANRHLEDQ